MRFLLWPASAATPVAAAAATAAPAAAPAAKDAVFPKGILAPPAVFALAAVPTGWAVAAAPAFAARELEVLFSRSSRCTACAVGRSSAGGAVAARPPVVGTRVLTSWYAGGAPPLGFLLACLVVSWWETEPIVVADRCVGRFLRAQECRAVYESNVNECALGQVRREMYGFLKR